MTFFWNYCCTFRAYIFLSVSTPHSIGRPAFFGFEATLIFDLYSHTDKNEDFICYEKYH
jgi:hypothetical protein